MPRREPIDVGIAGEFLSRSFAPNETLAIVLRRTSPATIAQRIVILERALQPRYLRWLAHENAEGANVYFAANPLVSGSRKRTKESVAEVRHLYLDLDTDGKEKLAALRTSNVVPIPTAIVSTSPGKYQVLWRVESIPFAQQEALLKLLAITFGGDPACTDCNRVLRLPGFLNQKYAPAQFVTVDYPSLSVSHPGDFKLRDPVADREPFGGLIEYAKVTGSRSYSGDFQPANPGLIRGLIGLPKLGGRQANSGDVEPANPDVIEGIIGPLKPAGKHSHSESDWAWILGQLARGKDPLKLTRTLAERRPDKSDPGYYAMRTVDVASAWIWLKDGIPMADVVTMLEVRRRFQIPDKLCSARAHEIAFTA